MAAEKYNNYIILTSKCNLHSTINVGTRKCKFFALHSEKKPFQKRQFLNPILFEKIILILKQELCINTTE